MAESVVDKILALPRVYKRLLAVSVDALACLFAVSFAYYLRIDAWIVPSGVQWTSFAAAVLFAIPIFISFGLYRAIFRYAGWPALMAVARAGVIYGLMYSTVFTIVGVTGVPRTIGIIQPILLFLLIGTSRGIARFWLGGGYETLLRAGERRRVLIYGAGATGRQLAAALANNQEMKVVGFVDDDPTLQGSVLNGDVIYPTSNLPELFGRLGIDDLLLALPSVTRKRRNEILEAVRGTRVLVRTLPGLSDLASGRVAISDIRELDIEDLLGRDAVGPNAILLSKNITGKTVMVTGAGGSIGSELCRQIILLNPAALVLVDMSEFGLYSIHKELESTLAVVEERARIVPLLASVANEAQMQTIISTWKPQTIYHTAAYKHVPLVEYNSVEGVRNNVFGTLAMAKAAIAANVQDFVLVSTDKAVRPTNVMGTTKRLAEMILQALTRESSQTRFCMVRFGNVLGSSGSVVPLFREQIKQGGPITITHQDVTRYFMTIPEAAQLVIQAGAMATGGEVFVLDMGNPVRVVDLARNMIALSGLTLRDDENPDGDIEISVVGLRPGEKLFEELLIGNNPTPTNHARIMKAREDFLPWSALSPKLEQLYRDIGRADPLAVRHGLMDLVKDFSPYENMADLMYKKSNL